MSFSATHTPAAPDSYALDTPQALRAARERLGLSLRGLADLLGHFGEHAPRRVARWERGEAVPSFRARALLRDVLICHDVIDTDNES